MSWRKIGRHPAPRAWVVRTALNANVSWWRRRRREVTLGDHDVATHDGPEDRGLDGPLVTALRRLPLRQREVIALRLLLDLDTETTARVLGISRGTVGVHLHRALEALRGESPGYGRLVREQWVRVNWTVYVNPATYLPVRVSGSAQTFGGQAGKQLSMSVTDVQRLPPTSANVARTPVTIPVGFRQFVGPAGDQ